MTKRRRRNKGKGSAFERRFAKQLSLWWTANNIRRRDDVFWRSHNSGGRATVRGRKNRKTYGQYGDICATDPIGEPLLNLATIELKAGYASETMINAFDKANHRILMLWEKWVIQAEGDAKAANAFSWMIVHQRTGRKPVVYMPKMLLDLLRKIGCFSKRPTTVVYHKGAGKMPIIAMLLNDWFAGVKPKLIKRWNKEAWQA